MICLSNLYVKKLGVKICPSSQSAHQADGSAPLTVVGETTPSFVLDDHEFLFDGLVVGNLDVEVLAGILFMERNDIREVWQSRF